MSSKVSSDWLPNYIKATGPVLEIFKWLDTFRTVLVHYTKSDFIQSYFSGLLFFYLFSYSFIQWPTTSMQVFNHEPPNHQKVLFRIHLHILHNVWTHVNYYDVITFHTLQQTNAPGVFLHSVLSPTQHDYKEQNQKIKRKKKL